MISLEQARKEYTAARDALNAIARSDAATAAQREDARAARDELTINYIGQMAAEGDALTAQYQAFITRLASVTNELGADHPVVSNLTALQGVIDRANGILKPV